MSPVLRVEHNIPIPPRESGWTWERRLAHSRRHTGKFKRNHHETAWQWGFRWVTCEGCHDAHVPQTEKIYRPQRYVVWSAFGGMFGPAGVAVREPMSKFCAQCRRTYDSASQPMQYDDAPLMAQHTGPEERRTEPTGEQKLAAALISGAVYDLHRETQYHGKRQYRDDVKKWLLGAPALMSFSDCCDLLGLDPDWLRRVMLHWPHNPNGHLHIINAHQFAVDEDVPDPPGGSLRSHPGRNLPTPLAVALIDRQSIAV